MDHPIKLVYTSALLFILFIILMIVLRKHKHYYFLLVLAAALIPCMSIFRQGIYQSGDFGLHIFEAMSFFDAIRDGALIPKWGGELNATYGYPVFLFAYPLPNYIIVLFHALGLTFVMSMKMFLTFSFVLSGIFMYMFSRTLLDKRSSFASSILYLYAPYHLVDLHFRVAIGEVLAFVFIPLIFLFIIRISKKITALDIALLSVSTACLVLSHQAVSLSTMAMAIPFVICINPSKKKIFAIFAAIFIGLMACSFYWVPVLVQKQYTLSGIFPQNVAFSPLHEFIFSPWRWGLLFQGPNGELSFLIGYIHIILAIIAFRSLGKITKNRNIFIFFWVSIPMLIILMTEYSKVVWSTLPLISNFQFTYRLLAVLSFAAAIMGGMTLQTLKKGKYIYIISLLAMGVTLLNWGNRAMIPDINDSWLRNNIPNSTAAGEGNGQSAPLWVSPNKVWETNKPQNHLEIIKGNGSVTQIQRTSIYHSYIVLAQTKLLLRENTLYFPGWNAYLNKKKIPIIYKETVPNGVMYIKTNPGAYLLEARYEKTNDIIIANILSTGGAIAISILLIYSVLEKVRPNTIGRYNFQSRK